MGQAARKGRARRAVRKAVKRPRRIDSATWTGRPTGKMAPVTIIANLQLEGGEDRFRHYGQLALRYGLLAFVLGCLVTAVAAYVS